MQFSQNFHNLQSFSNLDLTNKKIGILGGSFNPPHEGHLAISEKALEIGLDHILWLVVPQNNLKPAYELSLDERIKLCCKLTKNEPRIFISNLELEIQSSNSFDTLKYLTEHFPKTKFIWLMGVDCLKEFHLWENYDRLPELVDMIIFNRRSYTDLLENSIAGKMLKEKYNGVIPAQAGIHSLVFVPEILSELSSTEIRKKNRHPEKHVG